MVRPKLRTLKEHMDYIESLEGKIEKTVMFIQLFQASLLGSKYHPPDNWVNTSDVIDKMYYARELLQ